MLAVGPQFSSELAVVAQGNCAGTGHQSGKRELDGTDHGAGMRTAGIWLPRVRWLWLKRR